jgi:signal transducing adaptor molecule
MFSGPTNPYDELVNKATDENLASENWDVNLQICDKVNDEGAPG